MGKIDERCGKYRAMIRKKGVSQSATFSNRETAELWIKYKEDIIDEMEAFEVVAEDFITLKEAVEIKIEDLRKINSHKKTIEDIANLHRFCHKIYEVPINRIKVEDIKAICEYMLNETVRIGGSSNIDTGIKTQQSPVTVLKKLRALSCVFGFMMEKGAKIANPVSPIINELRASINLEKEVA